MFKSILLPIDLDQKSSWEKALPVAEEIARDYKAKLHIVSVMPTFGLPMVSQFFPEGFEKKATAEAEKLLGEMVALNCADAAAVTIKLIHGTIYDEIMKYADKHSCDLIVMASHRPELQDYLLGPNAARVVRHAKSSVFVVRS